MARITQAMILAAGKGTRLGALTQKTPKPLIEVAGVPVLIHVLNTLKAHGVTRIAMNTHYLGEQIEEAAQAWARGAGVMLHISHEEELLNTGGGICASLPFFEGKPFFLVNGDAVWTEGTALFEALENTFDDARMDACLSLIALEKTAPFRNPKGDFSCDEESRILARSTADAPWVYMCAAVLTPTLFNGRSVEAFSLIEQYDTAMQKGRLYGMVFDGLWADMGTPEGLDYAQGLLTPVSSQRSA